MSTKSGELHVDLSGNVIWEKSIGNPVYYEGIYSIDKTTDDGYILAGTVDSVSCNNLDYYLLKVDSNGNMVWSKRYGGQYQDNLTSVQETNDGGYIAGGTTRSFGAGSKDIQILKFNKCGDTTWSQLYGDESTDEGCVIFQTLDNGYIIAGGVAHSPGEHIGSFVKRMGAQSTYPEFKCGDANGDCAINLLDATYILNYLYYSGPAPNPIGAADANGNGAVNVLDVTYLIDYIYKGESAPVCPPE